jgi:hypothetical protein
MTHVDTGAALGLLGFELDLRGCDHFELEKTPPPQTPPPPPLRYVARVNAKERLIPFKKPWWKPCETCAKICVSVTGGA